MQAVLNKLKEAVFTRRPILERIYAAYGHGSVLEYVGKWNISTHPAQDAVEAVVQEGAALYGQTLGFSLKEQLAKLPLVSTIDHHGILNHPFFLNSNLLFSFRNSIQTMICLSTAGISLNNSSWPAALVYNALGSKSLQKISLLPSSAGMQTVLAASPLQKNHRDAFLKKIQNTIVPNRKLLTEWVETWDNEGIFENQNFLIQASLLTRSFWKAVFPSAPSVCYIPVEMVCDRLLTGELRDPSSIFYALVGSKQGWDILERHFNGMNGAYISPVKGSFLFWGLDQSGKRIHLQLSGGSLTGQGIMLPLKPETLIEALENKKIYPTSLVCFLLLLHKGLTCLGGFNQTSWLADIKTQFAGALRELGRGEEAGKVEKVVTDNFAESSIAFISQGGQLKKASALDVLGQSDAYERYRGVAKAMSLSQSMEISLPEMYQVVVPASERHNDLSQATSEQIAQANGAAELLARLV